MKLNPADWHLSMRISRKSRVGELSDLRSLLVHRLRSGAKMVLRLPMKQGIANPKTYGLYCEQCKVWVDVPADALTAEVFCVCSKVFRLEFAVYSQVDGQ